jgi:hypothetical protein
MDVVEPTEKYGQKRNQNFDKTEEKDDKAADFSTNIHAIDSARGISVR